MKSIQGTAGEQMKIPDREDAINAVDILVRYIEQCGKDLREGLEKRQRG